MPDRCLEEQGPVRPEQQLLPNRVGGRLSRTTVTERLQLATEKAARKYPELARLTERLPEQTALRAPPALFRVITV